MRNVGRSDRWTVGLVITLTLLSAHPPIRPSAQSRLWRPEERVILSDFSFVEAIAASPWFVYAATPHGLTIYDRRARRWQLPVTALDGYPTTRVRSALADPLDNSVWLATDDGWYRYDAQLLRWDHGVIGGGVGSLVMDARDPASGIWLQTMLGWQFLPRGGLVPEPGRPLPAPGQRVQPLDARTALAQAPMADAMRALILTDPRLRTYQFTAAARTADQAEMFFGTTGIGVVRVDLTSGEFENLSYGLLTPRATAVTADPRGAWVAGLARVGDKRGLTWVADDASRTTPLEGPGPGYGYVDARRLLASGHSLWLATDGGLLQIDPGNGRSRRFDGGTGLPADGVLAVATAPDGVWVGTAHGLAVVGADDKVTRIGTLDQAILSLATLRDTLWVGTAAGLGALAPGDNEIAVPPEVAQQPSLKSPIVALARVADTLVAATTDQLAWRDPASGRWTVARARADLGPVTVLVGDAGGGGVWIGGRTGLTFWAIARGTFHTLQIPGDLPAPVRDLAATRDYLWVATDSGLVRLERGAALGR